MARRESERWIRGRSVTERDLTPAAVSCALSCDRFRVLTGSALRSWVRNEKVRVLGVWGKIRNRWDKTNHGSVEHINISDPEEDEENNR